MDKVICAECGSAMTYINNKHLASHQMTAKEYHEKFPNSPLMTDAVAERLSERSKKANIDKIGKPRSQADKDAIQAGKDAAKIRRNGAKIKRKNPMSLAQRQLLSKIQKESYANGFQTAFNLGKKLSQETKNKISLSLTGRKTSPEANAKRMATRAARNIKMPSTLGMKLSLETRQKISVSIQNLLQKRRPQVRSVMLPRIEEANLTLLNNVEDDIFHLQCNICAYQFTRTPQMFQPSKFDVQVCDQCFPISKRSKQEIEVGEFIKSLLPDEQLIFNDYEIIPPKEIDIFIPSKNIAIEYCGLYNHSEYSGKYRYYHRKKFDDCKKKGIRLITIFSDEWLTKKEIVYAMLTNILGLNVRKVDARKCVVKQIETDIASTFLNENHIQGRGRSNIKYGLFTKDDDELISVMTFSNSEISRKISGWEINRFASKLGVNVRGGASKLFARFIQDYNPDKITSYADLRWGSGNVYEKMNFIKAGDTVPNYWYFRNGDDTKRKHRFGLRKQADDFPDLAERQLRELEGWLWIWDCGHAKWVWQRQ